MLGFGAIGEYAIGEFVTGGETVVEFAAAAVTIGAALAAMAGAVVPFSPASVSIAAASSAAAGCRVEVAAQAITFAAALDARAGVSISLSPAPIAIAAAMTAISGVSVAFSAGSVAILAALVASAGARVEVVNDDIFFHGDGSIGEHAIGESVAYTTRLGGVVNFYTPTIEVVTRLKRPTLQIIES